MPYLFDASLKFLCSINIIDFLPFLQHTAGLPARELNVDLSTITLISDAVIGLGDPLEQIIDLNFQSGPDPNLLSRIMLYHAALYHKYRVQIRSIVMLLRKKAEPRKALQKYDVRNGGCNSTFEYEKIRIWEHPSKEFLDGTIGMLPFAVLGSLPQKVDRIKALQDIVKQVKFRLERETSPNLAMNLMQATFNLTAMRAKKNELESIFKGVKPMTAFDEWNKNLNIARQEGRVEGHEEGHRKGRVEGQEEGQVTALRKAVLTFGNSKFGNPNKKVVQRINSISEVEQLDGLMERLVRVSSWTELLK